MAFEGMETGEQSVENSSLHTLTSTAIACYYWQVVRQVTKGAGEQGGAGIQIKFRPAEDQL